MQLSLELHRAHFKITFLDIDSDVDTEAKEVVSLKNQVQALQKQLAAKSKTSKYYYE